MSIRVTLNCLIHNSQFNSLEKFLEQNLPNVRQFEGCLSVNVLFDNMNNELLLDEIWESTDNHRAYIEFITHNGVLGKLNEFLKAPPTIKYFSEVNL